MYKTLQFTYEPAELDRWHAYDRHDSGFPQSQHLKYCKFESGEMSCERPHYFGEAWLCRHYHQQDCEVFHERYWLHDFSYHGRQTFSNARIADILGNDLKAKIEAEAKKLNQFANPDVIAFQPQSGALYLLELKLTKPSGYQDKMKPHQIESLNLLARLLPNATVAVAELKPKR